MEEIITKPKSFSLQLIQEPATDRKGKEIVDRDGNKSYRRDDVVGLMNLLNRFDSRLHLMSDYKMFLKLKDHILNSWAKEEKFLDLSLDEATFLKNFLSGVTTKDGKDSQLQEFEMRTLVGILDALG